MQEPAAPGAPGAAEPVTSPVDDDQARRSWPSALCRCVAPAAAVPLLLAPAQSVLAGARGSAGACERERESQARAYSTLTPPPPLSRRVRRWKSEPEKPSTGSSLSYVHETTGKGVEGFSRGGSSLSSRRLRRAAPQRVKRTTRLEIAKSRWRFQRAALKTPSRFCQGRSHPAAACLSLAFSIPHSPG